MAKYKSQAPAPTYIAEFDDGTVGRASFYSPAGKPYAFDDGRRTLACLYARPELPTIGDDAAINEANLKCAAALVKVAQTEADENVGHFERGLAKQTYDKAVAELEFARRNGPAIAASFFKTYPHRVIVNGWVEHDKPGQPWIRVQDPFFAAKLAATPVEIQTKRPSLAAVAKKAIEALRQGNEAMALELLRRAA